MRNATGRTLVAGLTLGLSIVATQEALAAEPLSIGAGMSWGTESGGGLGARVSWSERPALVVDLDGWLATENAGLRTNRREVAVNCVLPLRPRARSLRPYVGAGMSFIRTTAQVTLVSWDVRAARWGLGGNILAGLDVRVSRRYGAYVEARGQVWGTRQLAVGGGLRVALIQ